MVEDNIDNEEVNITKTEPVGIRRSKDRLFGVTLTQTVVSAVLIGVLFLCLKGGDPQLRTKIHEILTVSMTKQELDSAYREIKSVLTAPVGQWLVMSKNGDETTADSSDTSEQRGEAGSEEEGGTETELNEEKTSEDTSQKDTDTKDGDEKDGSTETENREEDTPSEAEKAAVAQTQQETQAENKLREDIPDIEPEPSRDVPTVNIKKLSKNITNPDRAFEAYCAEVKAVKPVLGRITSLFGYRTHPISGRYAFHSGLDIASAEGTRIKAAFYGTVTETGYSKTSGNYVIMSHSQALETRYYHCSKVLVDEGTVIRQGEIIALVGSTGISTGPHLHFEVRINGQRVDPQILYGNRTV